MQLVTLDIRQNPVFILLPERGAALGIGYGRPARPTRPVCVCDLFLSIYMDRSRFPSFVRWRRLACLCMVCTFGVLCAAANIARAQSAPKVIDIPTRPGVTQRFLYIAPDSPKAVAVLYAGGHGGLQLHPDGAFGWGEYNFLVRSRRLFVGDGLAVAVIDAPSDRQSTPFLNGFRQTPEHAADAKAVIAWLRGHANVPVWLIGTSRGTQSVASIAIALADGGGPDGIVLTSTILRDVRGGRPVTDMNLAALRIPVLVVHHQNDACPVCAVSGTSALMEKLTNSPREALMIVSGGAAEGDPCEAFGHHGFNGVEGEVVDAIARWITAR